MLVSNNITVQRKGAPLLRFPDLTIGRHDKILLLGPSGCGKTTLLSVLAGLLAPDTGAVSYKEDNLYTMPRRRRDMLRGQYFGIVFQNMHLLPFLTVDQNISLAARLAAKPADADWQKHLVDKLGLAEKVAHKPRQLSIGQQQRVALARASINKPEILFADEPTSALDDRHAENVMELMTGQVDETGAALVVASHDHRIARFFTRTIILEDILS